MLNEQELRQQLAAYVAQQMSLAALERRLNSAFSQPVPVDSNDAAFKLMAAVRLLVSERHDNVISAKEFRSELIGLLNHIDISIDVVEDPDYAPFVTTRAQRQAQWVLTDSLQVQLA